jgi:hypothetical protein
MTDAMAAGFLSYARADDEREHGRISRLAADIAAAFATITGSSIDIWVDRDGIQWGDPFRKRLSEALQSTTFFIPVLTPTYFLRDECRKEMQAFVTSARSLGLHELLLSIRYVDVPGLNEESPDELKAIAASMQYADLTSVRFEEPSSGSYRKKIDELANRLVELTRSLETRPATRGEGGSDVDLRDDIDEIALDTEAPGLLDLLADFQPAAEQWSLTMVEFPAVLEPFTTAFTEAGKEMVRADLTPNPFATRLAIARRLAIRVVEPLVEIERVAKQYSVLLLRIDPAIGAFIDAAAMSKVGAVSPEASAQLDTVVSSLLELIASSLRMSASVDRAALEASKAAPISRDLRPILRRFEVAMHNFSDANALILNWSSKLEATGLVKEPERFSSVQS